MMHKRLERDIAFLTGPAAGGRLSGTAGAHRAAQYLRAELASMGFDAFLQALSVPAARLTGTPHLKVAGRTFVHRRDFADMTAISGSGYASGKLLVVDDEMSLPAQDFRGRVVLIPSRPQGFNLSETVKMAAELSVAALLVEQGEPEWFHKTVYTGQGQMPVLRLRRSLADELAAMQGAHVELGLPIERSTLQCNNVLGIQLGQEEGFTLALTAHYDHVGDDPGGARFPGAFDNASGVASVLATARGLSRARLPFGLLIAFLTGEESGLWGARQLVAHPPVPISAAINVDGIGSEPRLHAMRLGHTQRGDWLAELVSNVLMEHGVSAKWIGGSDDSSVFISKGIPTVGLGQQPTANGPALMHTPLDRTDALYMETIREGVEILLEIVKTIGQSQNKENSHDYAR